MSRSRRMPPLFEVMHEANKKAVGLPVPSSVAGGATPASDAASKTPGEAARVFPRITSVPEEAATASSSGRDADHVATPLWDADQARTSGRRVGIRLSFTGVWLALFAVLAVVVVTAYVAYKAGAEEEKNRLLGTRTDPPPSVDEVGDNGRNSPSAIGDRPSPIGNTSEPADNRINNPSGNANALPVFGDDPRQKGWNYLNVATLFLKDATAAAKYLTENGVACAVVPPEGMDSVKLQEDRRGNWRVVVRAGYAPQEYNKPAVQAQRVELMERVKKLGKLWKDDHKGASAFRDCFWDKHGK